MKKLIFSLALLLLVPTFTQAQESNPLQPFEFLIGGTWSTETTVQTFEWGVGQKSVHSKLYFINAADTTLNGEITWFWHPGEQAIKGYGHLLSDQISFFDYSTEFENPRWMNNQVVGFNNQPNGVNIFESIEFIGDDEYRWTMYSRVLDELKPEISIVFNRKN